MGIEKEFNVRQGHWILAKAGKRVLRPGGRKLTNELIREMNISQTDDVVELAPGLGFTAALACARKPRSYTGVDRNEEAAARVRKCVRYEPMTMIVADAAHTTLPDAYATKVFGEAMLTMQPLAQKKEIIREAVRVLKPGGFYGIHELGLKPDHLDEEVKKQLYKDLSANIRVHARPLTTAEWRQLLADEGLEIIKVATHTMALLEWRRVVQDEGILRTFKIIWNVLTHADLRRRILQMRHTFRKHKSHMNAVAIVAKKVG